MTIDIDKILNFEFPIPEETISIQRSILYSLGLGLGLNPTDQADLVYLDESRLQINPTIANVLADNGFWLRKFDMGLNWQNAVHAEQFVTIHKPLQLNTKVKGKMRIVDLVDKGADKGCLLYMQRELLDAENEKLLATVMQVVMCRADGGFGGPSKPSRIKPIKPAWEKPTSNPDQSTVLHTSPQQALIYRLSGDLNPLHIDPQVAEKLGYKRPLLHGLSFFGLAGHGLIKTLCNNDPNRMQFIGGRFTAPVLPGDDLVLHTWKMKDGSAKFIVNKKADNTTVINHGYIDYKI